MVFFNLLYGLHNAASDEEIMAVAFRGLGLKLMKKIKFYQ
jgi:hypothetical protein